MPFSVPKERQSSEGICKIMRNVMSTFDKCYKSVTIVHILMPFSEAINNKPSITCKHTTKNV